MRQELFLGDDGLLNLTDVGLIKVIPGKGIWTRNFNEVAEDPGQRHTVEGTGLLWMLEDVRCS